MGGLRQIAVDCGQVQELISLELDGELSELEAARLDAHLAECAACRELSSELGGLTLAIRTTAVEQLERPITLPRRVRWSLRPLQVGAAAAAVAIAAGLAGIVGTMHSRTPAQPHFVSPGKARFLDGNDGLRSVRRSELIPQVPVGQAGGRQNV
jgi:predicted anti-sigma-YlaC factor YlaD